MKHAIVNPAVLLSPLEGGYVAYDPTSDQLHRLNPVAALIVELSDGRRSVEAIRALVSPLLPADAEAEVDRWIEEAEKRAGQFGQARGGRDGRGDGAREHRPIGEERPRRPQ